MKQKLKLDVWVLLLSSVIIILLCMALVWIFGQAKENILLSQEDKTANEIQIGGTYLDFSYPWEKPQSQLKQAKEEAVDIFRDTKMEENLTILAAIIQGKLEIEASHLWVDEAGTLIYQSDQPGGMSFAVNENLEIVGFGISAANEKDLLKKEENIQNLAYALSNPVHELYTIFPAIQETSLNLGNTEHFGSNDVFGYINGLKKQVLYHNDTLEVIIELELQYLVMQFDPDTGHFTSVLFLEKP